MIPAMISAASTVAIVAIAAVVIWPPRADLPLAPRRPTAPVGPFLGMGSGDRFEVSQGDSGLLEGGVRLTDETA
jgi:hypothetical protein